MATTHKTTDLDCLVSPIVDALPYELLAELAMSRRPLVRSPLELCRRYARPKRREHTLSSRLSHALILKARARLETLKAGPLPDEPEFNEETKQTLRDAREGKGLIRSESWDSLFSDLGM